MASLETHGLLRLLDAGKTPYHVVDHVRTQLLEAGFSELPEGRPWVLEPGHGFFTIRNQGSVFAFRVPVHPSPDTRFHLIGAHVDSPALRIKPNASIHRDGFHMLDVEVYGGALWHTWLDHDLGFAGMLVFRRRGVKELGTRLIAADSGLRIPSLAIHLDREVNSSGLKLNPQNHLMPVLGLEHAGESLQHVLESHLEPTEELVDFDLWLHDRQPAALVGLRQELVSASHIDDLAMVHASIRALCDTTASPNHVTGVALFHHEEVGSETAGGAAGNFLGNCLERVTGCLRMAREQMMATLSKSLLISADMAHAVHPGYEDKYDPNHRPRIGRGPVLKVNSSQRYATDALSGAKFRELCRSVGCTPQVFASRNDVGCGSTIGPLAASRVGIPTVDVGNPMLAMHSLRELAGTEDHETMIRVFKAHFMTE